MKRLLTVVMILFWMTAFAQAQALPHRKHTRPPHKGNHQTNAHKALVPRNS